MTVEVSFASDQGVEIPQPAEHKVQVGGFYGWFHVKKKLKGKDQKKWGCVCVNCGFKTTFTKKQLLKYPHHDCEAEDSPDEHYLPEDKIATCDWYEFPDGYVTLRHSEDYYQHRADIATDPRTTVKSLKALDQNRFMKGSGWYTRRREWAVREFAATKAQEVIEVSGGAAKEMVLFLATAILEGKELTDQQMVLAEKVIATFGEWSALTNEARRSTNGQYAGADVAGISILNLPEGITDQIAQQHSLESDPPIEGDFVSDPLKAPQVVEIGREASG